MTSDRVVVLDTETPSDERYFEPGIETMSRSDIKAYQEQRLMEVLPYAYERSGLIRKVWDEAGVHPRDVRSFDDFVERVPFISKDHVREYRTRTGDPSGGLQCVPQRELTSIFSTSGTTGNATLMPEQQVTRWGTLATHYPRFLWAMGLRPGDYFFSSGSTFRGAFFQSGQMVGAIPILADVMVADWEDVLDLIARYRPAWMRLTGAGMIALSDLEDRYDLPGLLSSFKAVTIGGEPLGPAMRARAEGEWGLTLIDNTSAGDVGIAMECLERSGCHVLEDIGVYESLDLDGRSPVEDGALGELVTTSLDDMIAPLVRFRSDDIVRLTRQTCGCGRTHARFRPMGRKSDEVVVEGRSILPVDVWPAIEQVPATSSAVFQVIRPQREMDVLRLRVGYRQLDRTDPAGIATDVADAVEQHIGIRPEIELQPEAELLQQGPAHKVPRTAKS